MQLLSFFFDPHSENYEEHQCFQNYNPDRHDLVADENNYLEIIEKDHQQIEENEEATNSNLGQLKWTDDSVRFLIQTYKEHLEEFLSTKEKNVKVWGRVSKELIANGFNYTQNQCMFKFKYLKSKYMLKKDNMKGGASGQARVNFKFLEEMDTIFAKKPNVEPVSLASNTRHQSISEDIGDTIDIDELNEDQQRPMTSKETKINEKNDKKRKVSTKSLLENIVDNIDKTETKRDEKRQKRHDDNLEFKQNMLNTFSNKMDTLIEVLKNK